MPTDKITPSDNPVATALCIAHAISADPKPNDARPLTMPDAEKRAEHIGKLAKLMLDQAAGLKP